MLYFCQAQPNVKLKFNSIKELYNKIKAIANYSGFKNWANAGHFEFSSHDEEKG